MQFLQTISGNFGFFPTSCLIHCGKQHFYSYLFIRKLGEQFEVALYFFCFLQIAVFRVSGNIWYYQPCGWITNECSIETIACVLNLLSSCDWSDWFFVWRSLNYLSLCISAWELQVWLWTWVQNSLFKRWMPRKERNKSLWKHEYREQKHCQRGCV